MKKNSHKTWLSPCVALTFVIVVLTGILMLFHIKNGYLKSLHEWIGLLFGVAGIVHLLLNWPVFVSYLKRRGAVLSVMSVLLLSMVCLLGGENEQHDQGQHGNHMQPYGLQQHGKDNRR
ncbi:MAG: DUF4405 domain-containing protein [Proteobacteria bacterium]|nr:DUF4405 domain-containing protein [Pseudomonadota bacterium]MBU1138330.1 DUF4405 domain-containing protein [Pseudomonadota bacterium]